jgi:DNA-binding NarL/FixJ family response regulator
LTRAADQLFVEATLPPPLADRPISVCLVEDDRGTRETIVDLLKRAPSVTFLDSYATAEEALAKIPARCPDVALVDINLPGVSGIECVARLNEVAPELSVLMLTTHDETDLIFESLRAGASGYLLKNQAYTGLVEAVHEVHGGGSPMSMQIARKVVRFFRQPATPNTQLEVLTAREQEILALLATGKLYKEIGDRLGISLSTVRGHLHKVYAKLHVQSRTEAVIKYLGRG